VAQLRGRGAKGTPVHAGHLPRCSAAHSICLYLFELPHRGNVIDLAVAIVVGTSFTALVK